MPYQYYREWGMVDGPADWVQLLIALVCLGVIVVISEYLLKRQRFRAHLVFLALMAIMALAVVTIMLDYGQDNLIVWMPEVFLVLCLWDHYWARNRLGQTPMLLKKAKRIQIAAAVILAACGALSLGIGFFQDWNGNGWNLGVTFLVSAGYVAVHSYFHRNDTTAKQFDQLL